MHWSKPAQVRPSAADEEIQVLRADARPQMCRRRGLVSADAVPFSWIQCAISVFAYIWLLTNFVRTEFAIHDLAGYQALEPDVLVALGPYAYVGNVFTKSADTNGAGDFSSVTASKPVTVWSYKFDTTSLAIRAFAELANVSAFPECVLYRGGACSSELLSPATGMRMLDALVDAVHHKASVLSLSPSPVRKAATSSANTERQHLRPETILLRVSYDFFDRIHHYLLPWLLLNSQWRTMQASYYSPELLASAVATGTTSTAVKNSSSAMDLCSLAYGEVRPVPCDESWTNFERACKPSNTKCRAVERVSLHTMRRLGKLKAAYANATVDLLVLDSLRDVGIHRGGLTYVGKRGADIVTIMRVRNCTSVSSGTAAPTASVSPPLAPTATIAAAAATVCDTQVVDDYRYEMETCTTDVLKWFHVVYFLRAVGQLYYWLRLAMLYGGCYAAVASTAEPAAGHSLIFVLRTARRALVVFFKIPSQVIVYGSPFPVACYLLAHVIDSPMVYDFIGQKFDSLEGLMHLSFVDLIAFSSIQMRNVWILAAAGHAAARLSTQHNWSPTDGVWGMPQFSIALVSSLTIVSQFRFISLRQTPVTSIEHIPIILRLHPAIGSLFFSGSSAGKSSLGGIFLDLKAVASSAVVVAFAAGAVALTARLAFPKSSVKVVFWRSYSVTPLSVGELWPVNALAVSWSDDMFYVHRRVVNAVQMPVQLFRGTSKVHLMKTNAAATPTAATVGDSAKASLQLQTSQLLPAEPMQLRTLDDRPEAVEAAMYLMNIAMLSDPVTLLLAWRWNAAKVRIGYYRSAATQHVYLLPLASVMQSSSLDWSGFTLERTVSAEQLTWCEIITCG